MTVLDNLRRKGMVSRTKDGRAYRYSPVLTREEHTAALMEQVLATSDNRHCCSSWSRSPPKKWPSFVTH